METCVIAVQKPWMKVIPSNWAFKRKWYSDCSIRSLKACFCAHVFEQCKGIDYFETFALAVKWFTIYLILVMIFFLNLKIKQIDYTLAFIQPKIDTKVYLEMPKGFPTLGKVWLLEKSLTVWNRLSPWKCYLHMNKKKLGNLDFTFPKSLPAYSSQLRPHLIICI